MSVVSFRWMVNIYQVVAMERELWPRQYHLIMEV